MRETAEGLVRVYTLFNVSQWLVLHLAVTFHHVIVSPPPVLCRAVPHFNLEVMWESVLTGLDFYLILPHIFIRTSLV